MRPARLAAAALLLSACASCTNTDKAGSPAAAPEIHLTLATRTRGAGAGAPYAREVERLSGGSITIDVASGAHRDLGRGSDSAILADVKAGVVDLGVVSLEALQSAGVDSLDALAEPGLLTSIDAEAAVARSSVGSAMLAGVERAGVAGLAIAPGPIHHLATFGQPITSLAELRAKPFLVTGTSAQAVKAVRDLGAEVVLDDRGDALNLDVGAVDASPSLIGQRRADSAQGTLFGNLPLWPQPVVVVMNRETLAGLEPAQRDVLSQAGLAAATVLAAEQSVTENDAIVALCRSSSWTIADAGVGLVSELRGMLDAEADQTRGGPAATTLDQIGQIVEGIDPPAALACPLSTSSTTAGVSGLAGTPAALVGRWRANATRENLDKAGIQPSESGTTGITTLTFDADGGLVIDFPDGSVMNSEVTAAGDTITITISEDASAEMGRGEVMRFTWSVFRDTLTLVRAPGVGIANGPTSLISQPFGRID